MGWIHLTDGGIPYTKNRLSQGNMYVMFSLLLAKTNCSTHNRIADYFWHRFQSIL